MKGDVVMAYTLRDLGALPQGVRSPARQMFLQECDLRRDRLFVRLEERGVMTSRQVEHLGVRRVVSRPYGGAGEHALVLVAHDDQQRAADPGGVPAGPVAAELEHDPCG